MAVLTRIKNNQVTDASAGNVYLGVNAAAKVQDYSITAGKIQNNLTYGSDLTVTGNLTVQGNTTTIDTVNLVVEDPLILLAKEQTGSPTLDIGFIGKRGTSDNIAWVWDESANSFVSVFTTSEVTNTTISISSYAAITTANISATTGNFSGNVQVANLSVVGNISGAANFSGNVTASNFLTTGLVSATGNITGGNVNTGGDVSATGNVNSGNVNTAIVSASGNVTGANLVTGGLITATGNVTGGNVLTGGLISATGNVNSGANIVATANVVGGNLTTGGVVTATGNVTGGNLNTGGAVSATGNVNSGNVNTGIISASGNVNGTGAVFSGNVTASYFFGNIAGNIDAAGSNTQVQFNDTGDLLGASANFTFDKATNILSVTGTVQGTTVSATGNVIGGNVSTAGLVTATGNVTGGNLNTGGAVSATGNVNSGNVNTGIVSASGNVNSGNVNTAIVSASGNVTGANLITGGLITATGNIIGPNIVTTTVTTSSGDLILNSASGVLQWDGSGNIVMNSQWINGLSDPVQAFDAATKQYVDDAVSSGIHIHTPVYVETPTALPSATYANGGNTFTVTDTVAGNTVVFSTAANLQVNDQLWFTNSFNGVVGNLSYFVVSTPNTSAAVLSTAYNGVPVSNITTGGSLTQPVRVNSGIGATLTATANGALVIDSVSVTATQRVLVYQQANAVQNGVYVVSDTGNVTAPWILTRSSDTDTYEPDTSTGLDQGSYFYVQAGATGAGESYVKTAPSGPFIFGYANIEFTQFGASQVYSANTAAGISLTGTVFSAKVDNDTTAFDGGGNISVKAGANLVTPNIGAATGTSLSVTGNVTGGNLNTGGAVSATGNVDSGNVNTAIVSATGNVNSGNVNTTLVSATGNVIGGNVSTAGLVTATGNVTGGNLNTGGAVSATGNVNSGNVNTGIVSASGNVAAVGFTGGNISVTGNVTAQNFIGNISGNIDAAGSNTEVQFNDDDLLGGSANFTFNKATNVLLVTGTIQGTTVSATGNVIGGNITTVGLISATGNITSAANVNANNVTVTNNVTANNASVTTAVYVPTVSTLSGNLNLRSASSADIVIDAGTGTGNINLPAKTANTILFVNADKNMKASANLQYNGTNANLQNGTFTIANVVIGNNNITSDSGTLTINGAGGDVDFAVSGDTTSNVFYVDAGLGTVSFGNSGAITNAIVSFNTTDSIKMPVGNQLQRPDPAALGMFRFSTAIDALEVYTSGGWETVGVPAFTVVTDDQFAGTGACTTFTLSEDSTTAATIVSINGVVQIPTTAYSVTGNSLVFTEAPEVSDVIDARLLTTTTTVTALRNISGNATVEVSDTSATVQITGNLLPTANVTYDLGSNTMRWNDAYFNGTSITLGNVIIKNNTGNTIQFFGPDGTTPATLGSTADFTVGNIFNANGNGIGNIGNSTTYFNTVFAKATSAQYADLAEMYVADQMIEPGTVVCFGGDHEVTVCNEDQCSRVAGVISTNPSYIMNAGLAGDHIVAVALTGRVPTRVTGQVRKGDMMVATADGRARAEASPAVGQVIGKALADFDGVDGVIEVVVGRL